MYLIICGSMSHLSHSVKTTLFSIFNVQGKNDWNHDEKEQKYLNNPWKEGKSKISNIKDRTRGEWEDILLFSIS